MARSRRVIFDIPTQADDKVIDGARIRILAQPPDILQHFPPRHRLPLVLDQIALRSAGLDWDAISHSDEIASFLRETRDHMNQISSIWLVDSAGRVRASSEATYPRNLTFEDREDFRSLREGGGMLVGKPHLGAFALTRRRSTTTGDFDGVFAIDVAIQYFESFFQGLDEQARHRAVLVRADGTVLAADSVGAEPRWFPPTSELMQ